jgi:hypothetical protein
MWNELNQLAEARNAHQHEQRARHQTRRQQT